MSTITLRARDSAAAFEQVEARLGRDALILSTEIQDGWVVVTARDGAAPRLAPRSAVMSNNANSLREACLAADRVVLLGPVGAGKTRVALQLAYLRLTRNHDHITRFVAMGFPSQSDAALLVQKCAEIGETVQFHDAESALSADVSLRDVVVVSGLGGPSQLANLPQGFGLLVLPLGQSSVAVDHYCRAYEGRVHAIVLAGQMGRVTDTLPLPVLWISDPTQFLEGLHLPHGFVAEGHSFPSIGDDR